MEVPQGNLLTVDEGVRPRANSDPTVVTGCKLPMMMLPEITVEDCTDDSSDPHNSCDQGGLFGLDATPRRRANTCPEDLFRKRNGRPPTPPPGTFRKGHRFKSGFSKPVMKESVSFTHHKLSKLTETEDVEEPQQASSCSAVDAAAANERLESVPPMVTRSETNISGSGQTRGHGTSSPRLFSSERPVTSLPLNKDSHFKAVSGNKTDKTDSTDLSNAEHFVSGPAASSVKCRFAQTKPPGIDSKQLQAC